MLPCTIKVVEYLIVTRRCSTPSLSAEALLSATLTQGCTRHVKAPYWHSTTQPLRADSTPSLWAWRCHSFIATFVAYMEIFNSILSRKVVNCGFFPNLRIYFIFVCEGINKHYCKETEWEKETKLVAFIHLRQAHWTMSATLWTTKSKHWLRN